MVRASPISRGRKPPRNVMMAILHVIDAAAFTDFFAPAPRPMAAKAEETDSTGEMN